MSDETVVKLLIEYGETLKGAEVYFRDDWECYYFSLLGKCFGMLSIERITLKGNPDKNMMLRQKYQDVTPGYYANKKHWNSIAINTLELTIEELRDLIYESYILVLNNLSRKEKTIIDEMYQEKR